MKSAKRKLGILIMVISIILVVPVWAKCAKAFSYYGEFTDDQGNVWSYSPAVNNHISLITVPEESYCISLKQVVDTEVVVPSEIDGHPVVGLGSEFSANNLTSLRIPSSIKYIGANAFVQCHDLKR